MPFGLAGGREGQDCRCSRDKLPNSSRVEPCKNLLHGSSLASVESNGHGARRSFYKWQLLYNSSNHTFHHVQHRLVPARCTCTCTCTCTIASATRQPLDANKKPLRAF
jgi:hypothetical protein